MILGDLFASLLPYVLGAVAALGAFWGYGRSQRSKGRQEAVSEAQEADNAEANQVRRRVRAARGMPDDNDGYRD